MKDRYMIKNGLLGLSFALLVGGLYLVFIYVPTEETMGAVQRIFYFHVPVAWIAFLAVKVTTFFPPSPSDLTVCFVDMVPPSPQYQE